MSSISAALLSALRSVGAQDVLRRCTGKTFFFLALPGTKRQHPRQMRACPPILAAILLFVARGPAHAASLIANGEFSSALNDWQQVGTVFDTGESAVLSDSATPRAVVFQTAVVPDGFILLQLSFDLLTALSPVAGVGQTPDSVFISAFLGVAPFGVNFDAATFDTAIAILDADYRGIANPAFQLASGPSPKGAGWTRYSLPLAPAAFATVAFEFIDGNGVPGDSTTAVDNVFLEGIPIPEPEFLAVLAAATFVIPGLGRRRKP